MSKLKLVALVLVLYYLSRVVSRRRKYAAYIKNRPKVFLVTGGASGIGKHMTTTLIAKGFRVVSCDLNFEALETLYNSEWKAHQDRCVITKLDVRSEEDWKKAVELTVTSFGSLDVLLNIAGYLKAGPGFAVDSKLIDLHFDINTKGMILGSQVGAEQMMKQNSGHIINISSLAGICYVPGLTLYCASKHAIRAYSRALGFDFIRQGKNVNVTVICPFAVKTPMLDRQKDDKEAALTFSSPNFLTVQDIEKAILENALPYKPQEIWLPFWNCLLGVIGQALSDKLLTHLTLSAEKDGQKVQNQVTQSHTSFQ